MDALAVKLVSKIKSKEFKNKINFFMDAFIAYGMIFVIIMCLIDILICYLI